MGATKTEQYTEAQNELANRLKALAHPARLAIVEQLLDSNTCVCGDLAESLGLAQPTVSRHLKELKNAGIIRGTIEGKRVCYCIDHQGWGELRQWVETLFARFEDGTENCC
jgi:DNA-binding transcriptional ArsR family regulator